MLTSEKVLDHYFLESRCTLLEIAATLDRYDASCRRGGDSGGDAEPRLEKLYQALGILADRRGESNRAERLLVLFSDPVD